MSGNKEPDLLEQLQPRRRWGGPRRPGYARPEKEPKYKRLLCWWCNKQLENATTGPNAGMLSFAVVKDPIGNEHKVHKTCEQAARNAR